MTVTAAPEAAAKPARPSLAKLRAADGTAAALKRILPGKSVDVAAFSSSI